MHCPQCGARIESDALSYCPRCGQMLDRVRVAMSEELTVQRGTVVSRSGVNLGVVLMYAGLWPALLTVILSPSAIPLAFLMLSIALLGIIFGSGHLLHLFQTEELHPEVVRARRKEIAFGATLMFLTTVIATLIVAAGIPDRWVKVMLIGKITAAFIALLLGSKWLYSAYRDLTSNDPLMLKPETSARELATSTLDPAVVDLEMPARETGELVPQSVTEHTTRSLDGWKSE